jgi:hypothetical protein
VAIVFDDPPGALTVAAGGVVIRDEGVAQRLLARLAMREQYLGDGNRHLSVVGVGQQRLGRVIDDPAGTAQVVPDRARRHSLERRSRRIRDRMPEKTADEAIVQARMRIRHRRSLPRRRYQTCPRASIASGSSFPLSSFTQAIV